VTSTNGDVLLEKRPPVGVWGGLWCFPECDAGSQPTDWCQRHLGERPSSIEPLPTVHHTFTHFRLHMHPVRTTFGNRPSLLEKDREWLWYNIDEPPEVGLATPVSRLLRQIAQPGKAA